MTLSYGKQTIAQDDIDAIVEVLSSDWLTQGPKIGEFENSLKKKFNVKYSSVVSSGTAALHLAGLALGWKSNDVIITTPLTFIASANSIVYCGAKPDFVDIDTKTYTIDPNQLEKKIKSYKLKGKKVKAIIAVDYAGHPCDWESLRAIRDKYEIQIVNDNCHAMGAKYKKSFDYAGKYADVVTQSYHPVKNFTTGEGGAVLTNDKNLNKKIEVLRSHGITRNTNLIKKRGEGTWYYEINELGYNYRITDFQCALGISQLKKLSKFVKIRRQIAKNYNKAFELDERFIVPAASKDVDHAYHLYPLQAKFVESKISKKDFFALMKTKGINLMVHYIPVHLQPYYQKRFGFKYGDFPDSEQLYENVFSIPIYPKLRKSDINFVISEITKCFDRRFIK